MIPQRIQMRRTAGWRKPAGAIYVGRPSPYGNPFPIDSDWMTWTAIAIGFRADREGRRQAAVALHRAWLTRGSLRLREFSPIEGAEYDGGALEFSDGSVVSMDDHAAGFAAYGASLCQGPVLPERPVLTELRGADLLCWCKLINSHSEYVPCHADVLLSLANGIPMDEVICENHRRATRQAVR